ncbi:Bacterial Ig-like domain (group 2) [uncultured Ruminococcus sp.]|nr:Bacterial Ig-like domain (group 2) [uncultured Ruminococcus sp.]
MKKKSKILSLLLAMVMLLSMCAIPVQAADTLQNQAKKVVMVVGQKTTIKTPVKMTFKSSNSKVAAVNSNGKVTAKAKGNATVTAKTSKVTWTYKIKVEKPKLNNSRLSVYTKTSKQLKLKGTSRKVTWSSSAPSVVSVNKKGKITARRTGKATITAKVNGVKYKCKVTVKARSKKSSGQSSGKSSGQASSSGVNGYVWIPATGSKYHSSASCSGMHSPRQVSISQAISMGYSACKKCY